jgi:hypothetical protein
MVPEVILHAVIVQQGVVHVKQEHNFTGGCHRCRAGALIGHIRNVLSVGSSFGDRIEWSGGDYAP